MNTKILAYYLPQFHEIPENNIWWGKGYTEWENAKKAKPLYKGHYQPKVPRGKVYYNLLNNSVMRKQAAMAENFGIYGFCFYHYWFGDGKKMLEKPAENLLADKSINMRFCFSWANENWTKTWEGPGGEKEVLIQQKYGGQEEWKSHFEYLLPFFLDDRYIKKEGKPVILIYRLDKIPRYKEMFSYWRKLAKEHGLEGLHIVQMVFFDGERKLRGVDAYTFYVPAAITGKEKDSQNYRFYEQWEKIARILSRFPIPMFVAKHLYAMYSYDKTYKYILNRKYASNEYMGAFPDFDSTARKGVRARIWYGSTPRKFAKYLVKILEQSRRDKKEFMFITAWNEWGEGNYLEPDEKYAYGYLKAIKYAKRRVARNKD